MFLIFQNLVKVSEVPFKQAWRPPFVVLISSSKETIRFLENLRQIPLPTKTCKYLQTESVIEKWRAMNQVSFFLARVAPAAFKIEHGSSTGCIAARSFGF